MMYCDGKPITDDCESCECDLIHGIGGIETMKITVEVSEDEILQSAKEFAARKIADDILTEYRSGAYCYRHAIKDVVREVIKKDIDNLSDRAVKAASVSIADKALKKKLEKIMEDEQ